jgi:hypothetical protein
MHEMLIESGANSLFKVEPPTWWEKRKQGPGHHLYEQADNFTDKLYDQVFKSCRRSSYKGTLKVMHNAVREAVPAAAAGLKDGLEERRGRRDDPAWRGQMASPYSSTSRGRHGIMTPGLHRLRAILAAPTADSETA